MKSSSAELLLPLLCLLNQQFLLLWLKRLVNRQLADVANDEVLQQGRGHEHVLLATEQLKQLLQLHTEVLLLLQKQLKSALYQSRLQHLLRHPLCLHHLQLPA